LALLLALLSGCASRRTIVEGRLQPRHFQFVTVVEQRGSEPGGWRAACVYLHVKSDTGQVFVCKFGVEMPIKTQKEGFLSTPLAQRIAADCANLAAYSYFPSTTVETPLGLACKGFKTTYNEVLNRAVGGSRVETGCHEKTTPVEVGPAR
jgi:hypothetical protein